MRTLVDIPDGQIKWLAYICSTEKKTRAELIRAAIAEYLEKHKPRGGDVFGIWKNDGVDGLGYQERLRSEW